MEQFIRTELLLGEENIEKLLTKHVLIFGVGGVGSFVCEALARTGIKNFTIVDGDTVDISNLNRQLIATNKTIGKYKVDVMKERILDINKDASITTIKDFLLPSSLDNNLFKSCDYIVDCIDTIATKLAIIEKAKELNIPIISSMGTGNKLDPSKLSITDLSKTSMCPLAKVMRYELRKRGIKNLDVLYSTEEPIKLSSNFLEQKLLEEKKDKRQIPGSIIFVPSVAGILIARHVVLNLINF